jgi:flagellar basal body-associated protein FliL
MKLVKHPAALAVLVAIPLLLVGYIFVLPRVQGGSTADAHAGPALKGGEQDVDGAPARRRRGRTVEPGLIFPVPDRVLNLKSTDGTPRYVRLELALEFEVKGGAAKSEKHEKEKGGHGAPKESGPTLDPALEPVVRYRPLIDDALIRIVGGKTAAEMMSVEGREALKQELLDAVWEIVPAPEVVGVYIVRLVVQ